MTRRTRPSFDYLVEQGHRRKDYPAVGILDKRVCRRVLESLEVPLPGRFMEIPNIGDLSADLLRGARVLKPASGSTSQGVFLLQESQPDLWHELLSDQRYTFNGILHAIEDSGSRVRKDGPWLLEELLLAPGASHGPALNVKAYTFRGKVVFLSTPHSRPYRIKFFTPDGSSLDVGMNPRYLDASLQFPGDPGPFTALASRISRALPLPFVRVDMYATDRGPVCGELTPLPGNRAFSDAWDEYLGTLYEHAETRLLVELAQWPDGFDNRAAWAAVAERSDWIRSRHTPDPEAPVISSDGGHTQSSSATKRRRLLPGRRRSYANPTRVRTPSFAYAIAAANRRKDYPVVGVLDKVTCRRLLESLDAPLPSPFTLVPSAADVTPDLLREPRAVKPTRGSSNRGVFLLHPVGRDRWFEVTTDREYGFAELSAALSDAATWPGARGPWIVEEFLADPHDPQATATEIKVYAFRGHVAMCLIHAHRPLRLRHFLANGTPVDVGRPRAMIDQTLPIPDDVGTYASLASDISARLPIPFLRVDMYVTSRGPVCGELTPLPGDTEKFSDEWDEYLGTLYERAESQVLTRLVHWPVAFDSPATWKPFADRAKSIRERSVSWPDPPAGSTSAPLAAASGIARRGSSKSAVSRAWNRVAR